MLTAEEARKLVKENQAYQEALERSVKYVLNYVRDAIEHGRCYVCVSGCSYDNAYGKTCWVPDEEVLKELQKLGYKKYTKPVYVDGVRQQSLFMTWMED